MSSSAGDDDPTVIRTAAPAVPFTRTEAAAPRPAAAEADSHALPLGTRLGEFELTAKLGEGGFSIVYLAWDHSLDRKVALKEYMPGSIAARAGQTTVSPRSERHREAFEAGLRSFINEGKLLARFDHRALVKVYRFWEANGTAYMVMPVYEGPTMKEAVRALASPPDEAWLMRLLAPLTEALQVIHAEQCYHRDIAPDNVILLAGSGLPLLLDFGAARRVIGDMTQALTIILKPGYAPVEQYAEVPGMRQGPWTDVYALAAVVYWCITGKTPPPSVGRMIRDTHVPLLECAAGRYSEPFLRAVDRALVVMPEQRTQTTAAFRREIGLDAPAPAASAASVAWEDPQATVIRPPEPRTRAARVDADELDATVLREKAEPAAAPRAARSNAPVWAGVAAALLAAGAGTWWALHRSEPVPAAPVSAATSAVTAPLPAPTPAPALPTAADASPPPATETTPAVPEPARVTEASPIDKKPAPRPLKPAAPKAARSEHDAAPDNRAECARIFQRLSLGEDTAELRERVKYLKCQ